jgi:carbonic anhydrase/acetyltransferase-like protein (isoleucine patch superfamily)
MILSFSGKIPQTKAAAFAAPNATLVGDITLEARASVWYGAVLRADTGAIRIGEGSNVQDNAVLHTGPGLDIVLGQGVTVGHSAIVHGCTVGDNTLVGMHATLMNGCTVGKNCVIAAGALVPQGMNIPDGNLAVGVPAKIKGLVTPAQMQSNRDNAAHYCALAEAHAKEFRSSQQKLHLQQL